MLALFGTSPWSGRLPWFSDLRFGAVPFRAYAAECAQKGVAAYWNPHIGCGLPFTSDSQGAIAYPLDLLWNHVDPLRSVFFDLCLHLVLGGLFVYAAALVRGSSRWAATVAGCFFVLCGTHFPEIHGFPCVRALMWMSAAVLGAGLLWNGRTAAGFATIVAGVALSLLAGHPQFTLYAFPVVAAVAWGSIAAPRRARAQVFVLVAAASLAGIAIAAVQWLPLLEYVKVCHRVGGISLESATRWALHPSETLGVLFERKQFGERPIIGLTLTALAILAIAGSRRRSIPIALAVAFALVAAMGSFTPLGAALQRVPPYSMFQYPYRHLAAASAGLALLAADGADSWRNGTVSSFARRATAAVVAALAITALLLARGEPGASDFARIGAGAAVLTLLALSSRPAVAASVLLLLLGAAELVLIDGRLYWTDSHVATATAATRRPEELRDLPASVGNGEYRVYTNDEPYAEHNRTSLFGIDNARAYVALIPNRLMQLVRLANTRSLGSDRPLDAPAYGFSLTNWNSPVADLLCVRCVVGLSRPGSAGTAQRPVRTERTTSLRQAQFVGEAREVATMADAASALLAPDYDPRRVVVVETEGGERLPPSEPEGADPVVLATTAHSTGVEVELAPGRAGWLHLAWNMLPGFTAEVDGRPTPLRHASVAFMAVHLPRGARSVVLTYVPPGLAAGRWISASGTIAAAACAFVLLRRRTAARPAERT